MSESVSGNSPAATLPLALPWPQLVALVLLYALLGYIGLRFGDGSGLVSTVWPASGLAAALALVSGPRALWVPFAGNLLLMFFSSLSFDIPALNAIGIAIGCAAANTGEAWFIQRVSGGYGPSKLNDTPALLRFMVLAAPVGSFFSALVGIATLLAFAGKPTLDPGTRLVLWWSGDMVGCLLIAPVLLTLAWRRASAQQFLEFISLMVLVSFYLFALLTPALANTGWQALLAPIGLPLLFWAVVRLRFFYLNLLLLLVGMVFVVVHFQGRGPFQLGTPLYSHLALQFFLVSLQVTTLLAATLLRERRQLNLDLRQVNQQLEQQVRERTLTIQQQSTRLREIVDALPLYLSVRTKTGEVLIANRAMRQLGESEPDWLQQARETVNPTSQAVLDVTGSVQDSHGQLRLLQAQVLPLHDAEKQAVLVLAQDVTERTRQQQIEQLHVRVLQRLTDGTSLAAVLAHVVQVVESMEPELLASILLVDHQRGVIRHAAAGRLPAFYCEAIDGIAIGHGVGSCGTAAAIGQRVIVGDIATDPLWQDYTELAARAGLAACWSEPVKGSNGQVLATFALYTRQPALPTPAQLQLIDSVAALVRLAIERHRAQQHLRQLSRAIEQTASAVMLCDARGVIEYVNASFSQMLGQTAEQAQGQSALQLMLPDDADGQLVRDAISLSLQEGRGWQGEFIGCRRDGNKLWLHASLSPISNGTGQIENVVAVLEDISSYKQAQAKVEYLAFHDALTGLANRRLFLLRLEEEVRRLRRAGGMAALLFFDLDEFKRINDTLGHEAGDDLLKQIAQRLQRHVREDDLVARLGGDEFCLLLGNLNDSIEAGSLARKLMTTVAAPMVLAEHTLSVSSSVGITLLPLDGDKADVLLRNADLAMYRAKAEGKDRFVFFAPEMNDVSRERLQLEMELRRGLEPGAEPSQFRLHYQPIVTMPDARLTGYEVLLRWQHPERGLLSPDAFIPVAEHTGLIVPLGELVLRQALQDLPALQRQASGLKVSVNVSARQLREVGFGARVARLMTEAAVTAGTLQLEITESLLLERSAITEQNLEALVAAGARVVIDDFGTGYTSFSQLRELPIHGIKLDRMFVRELPGNEDDAAIISALIAMARQLHLDVVAEGVETEAQRDFLVARGCQLGQGWLFGRPAPLTSATDAGKS
ncbi:EAL domain-containing protein [Permianibacter sp. IMCC34836]|uniref:bifunctional diguanylate cyclase/phosphodiesterase n=1 Tax=Permianibacter fluminis TaxID=2738515 RepID=UPI001556518D|nr:EAL domain-containing protein [Permianibacter fluminis]NQD36858.1 EAL domain-containing protein [Permianibacter fluminis]